MYKKTLSLTLSSAIASTLLSVAPSIQAGENPFEMSNINTALQLAAADEKAAEAGCSAKMKEGKCGEGKCGANKKKMTESASKAKNAEAKCGANKAKMAEGACSAKAAEAKCGAGKTESMAPAATDSPAK